MQAQPNPELMPRAPPTHTHMWTPPLLPPPAHVHGRAHTCGEALAVELEALAALAVAWAAGGGHLGCLQGRRMGEGRGRGRHVKAALFECLQAV
jgi:hypothetical protein